MRICVIDGRGGGLGRRLVAGLQSQLGDAHQIIGLGTNQAAATAMKAAGAAQVGAGGRAIVATVPTADVILLSLNLVLASATVGDVTPAVVRAILGARAKKVLLPVNQAQVEVVGTEEHKLEHLIARSLRRVQFLVTVGSLA
ncbi:MAG: DUF3842 family protein [Nitrospira sp.]|nr:DUF3842 family protein [Nitrospira sp.]